MPQYDSHGYDGRPSYDYASGPLFGGMNAAANQTGTSLATALPIRQGFLGGDEAQLVDSVQLHAALAAEARHNDWIVRRLAQHPCVEGIDYVVTSDFYSKMSKSRGRPSIRYALTVRLAKLIAMAERTPAGDRVRDYFLVCEQKAIESPAPASEEQMLTFLGNPEFLLRLTTQYAEKLKAAEAKIALDAPKVQSYQDLIASKAGMLVRMAAKEIGDVGEKRLYAWMRLQGIIMPETTEPYQRFCDLGYFMMIPRTYSANGEKYTSHTTLVTPKGLTWLQRRWRAYHAAQGGAE